MLSTLSGAIKSTGRRFQLVQFTPSSTTWGIGCRGSLPSFFRPQSMAARTHFLYHDVTTSASSTANTTSPAFMNGINSTKDLEHKAFGMETTATGTTTSKTTNRNSIEFAPKVTGRHWTLEEFSKLSQLVAEGKSVTEIHAHFPFRSQTAIRKYRGQIRAANMDVPERQPWSTEEDEKLRTFIQQGTKFREIRPEFPDRSTRAVELQWRRFGGKDGRLKPRAEGRKIHPWTEEEKKRLYNAVEKGMTIFEIHRQFPGRTPSTIRRHITLNRYVQDGVYQQHLSRELDDIAHAEKETKNRNTKPKLHIRRNRPWTPEEDGRLRDLVFRNSDDLPGLWNMMDDAYAKGGATIGDLPVYRTGKSSRVRWSQLNNAGYRKGPWDTEEIMKLKQSIQEQIGDGFQVMVDVYNGADTVAVEIAGQDTRPCLKANGPELRNLNWHKVSQQVGTRDIAVCRQYLMNRLHNGKHGAWSLDEIQRLEDGVEKFGTSWQKVAAYVGTRPHKRVSDFYWKRVKKDMGAMRK
ncbi:hypothetical protein BG011_002869 [Mortierella polycephala]|uniref:Uncharacterized protein n=1 Tax=Mortierella polycephala TaxID=41804 RepID=A0A9P6Q6D3_9FUNG|nr:hypothetical protein BG011_002869 [Mortierella polycephala]